MATASHGAAWRADQSFFLRMAIGISAFIVFAFAQWSARGMVNFAAVPFWVHLHGIVLVSWLALFVTQNYLANRGSLALHRKLGLLALVLMPTIVVLTGFTGYMAVRLGRQPPFYTPAQFLVLTNAEALGFGTLVVAGLLSRHATEWHRRFMLMAVIVLLAPAFGRTLPMPLLGPWGPVLMTGLMLAVVGICMLHDRRTSGRVHPASLCGAGVILTIFAAEELLMRFPPLIAFARTIATG